MFSFRKLATIGLLLFSSQVEAEESVYNMKIHRGFMKKIADANFGEVLRHIESK